jgi:hypothetical protein
MFRQWLEHATRTAPRVMYVQEMRGGATSTPTLHSAWKAAAAVNRPDSAV